MWGDLLLLFWFSFSWLLVMLNVFPYTFWLFTWLLWRHVYLGPLPIFKIRLSSYFFSCCWVVWVPYIFLILIPCQIYGLQIFSHVLYCLYILLIIFFAMRNFLVWYRQICLFFILLPVLLIQKSDPEKINTKDQYFGKISGSSRYAFSHANKEFGYI